MLSLALTLLGIIVALCLAYYVMGIVKMDERLKIAIILVALLFAIVYLIGGRLL